jgi:cyclopropane-fatty-acyl-phospholipid synthase
MSVNPATLAGSGSPAPRGLMARLAERLCRSLGPLPLQIELWNGAVLKPEEPPRATLRLARPRRLLELLLSPTVGLSEAYRTGELEVHGDLTRALVTLFREAKPAGPIPDTDDRFRSSGMRRARRAVRRHYDLGNDFFRLWLDERLVYTCAYFADPDQSLEQAQVAKMDYVCRKLRLRPGDRVLEAGCGWGALARHMAVRYGARVTACNVSREQIRYARERAQEEGLGSRVEYVEDDFRSLRGTYDAFVSIGMLEHVGRRSYDELGKVIHQRLEPGRGRGLLHFIGRNRPLALHRWVRRHIFPDAYPPTLGEVLTRVLQPWDFSVLDVENLRLHYARTLDHWRRRFEDKADRAAAMFDERFVRGWRLYLAGSQAAFATGWLQLFQVTFGRARDDSGPWTRAELYRAGPDDGIPL